MYLEGEKYLWTNWETPIDNRREDDYRIRSIDLELGYWRKHPNLHGYIVKTFNKNIDDCKRISLEEKDIEKIIKAIESEALPYTKGFFFGQSNGSEQAEDLNIFKKALSWLKSQNPKEVRSIYYKASW